jgi:hypothetical protein
MRERNPSITAALTAARGCSSREEDRSAGAKSDPGAGNLRPKKKSLQFRKQEAQGQVRPAQCSSFVLILILAAVKAARQSTNTHGARYRTATQRQKFGKSPSNSGINILNADTL